MAGFKDIIGHEQIIEHLQNAIGMDKVSHAYIINGPDKSGKMMLAEAFAMALPRGVRLSLLPQLRNTFVSGSMSFCAMAARSSLPQNPIAEETQAAFENTAL